MRLQSLQPQFKSMQAEKQYLVSPLLNTPVERERSVSVGEFDIGSGLTPICSQCAGPLSSNAVDNLGVKFHSCAKHIMTLLNKKADKSEIASVNNEIKGLKSLPIKFEVKFEELHKTL